MTTLQELIAQQKDIASKISALKANERSSAITKIRSIVDEFDLKPEDIFARIGSGKLRKTSTKKVEAKYRDPISGKDWSGRGLAPKWISGKNKEDYLIK